MAQAPAKVPALGKGAGNDPGEVSADIAAMRERALLAKTLMGGTDAMRAAGLKYLPKMRHEDTDTYDARLKLTVLRNFYRSAIASLAGKLMRNGLKVDPTSKGPTEMAEWLKDIDRCGTSGAVLFKRLFTWSIRDAACWILADYPTTGGRQTLADEREQGIRPWMIPLSLWDLNGTIETTTGGKTVIEQARYRMVTQERVGMFGTADVETIRVVEPTVITDFRRNSKNKWEIFGSPMVNTLGRVPLHRVASDIDEGQPRGGMDDLAWANMEHWQIRSDQRLTLRVNSFPILFGAGMASLPPIGPEAAVLAEEIGATLQYVESTGAALTAGRQELVDLEDAMRGMSAQYQAKQVAQTATGSAIDAKDAMAPAQGWAINAKAAFEAAMDDMAELAGKGKGSGAGGLITVDTDALVSSLDSMQLSELRAARASREISRVAYLTALKRADVLPDEYSIEDDQDLIDDEPTEDLAGMNTPPGKKKAPGK